MTEPPYLLLADIICEQSLIKDKERKKIKKEVIHNTLCTVFGTF